MCGRFSIITLDLEGRFDAKLYFEIQPRYNIAPSQDVPIILNEDTKHFTKARWGLVPHWAKDEKIGYKMINARAETLLERNTYKGPFKYHRCLIPADGFYEWKKVGSKKIPFRITMKDNGLFAFAGLYDTWKDMISFTIITTQPNSLLKPIHDRMPVILEKKDEKTWLEETDTDRLQKLLRPFSASDMRSVQISDMINSAKEDNPGVIKPAALLS
ncbi:MAG: SOS response-associated peptidase [Nanoarchaeota archaeon]|nr:SOS response-associated peptidase [Nanoarchaeota archaeon]MBU1704497.1 SOS response-associated peptidase [Nanoarchaeota archaeon]